VRIARRYLITGRVQGVGFRYFTQTAAVREGLNGWVHNRSDGGVEVFAEGELEAVDRFEHHLRYGPPGGRIDDVDVEDVVPAVRETGFVVK
jgi:acylphosphatase